MDTTDCSHHPVMLREVSETLNVSKDGFYVDCTFGRGGHSRAILERLGTRGRLLALDKDPSSISSPEAVALVKDPRFGLVHGSFAEIGEQIKRHGYPLGGVAGVLMDLGVSSPQLDEPQRGFSFLRDGALDMRMDNSKGQTASEWLDSISEDELARVLKIYGEERFARRIANAIVGARPIESTRKLASLIEKVVPSREPRKHPATRSFQAIRIALNRELDELEAGLEGALEILAPGGRLVVISFHSLEDRIVKNFIREQERGKLIPSRLPQISEHKPRLRAIGKARKPSEEEVRVNVRARSAVLRVAERPWQ